LPYLIVPVQTRLDSARISHPGFEGLLEASGAKFVYVLDPDRPEGRTWDNAGRVEDVATGAQDWAGGMVVHASAGAAVVPAHLPAAVPTRHRPRGRETQVCGPVTMCFDDAHGARPGPPAQGLQW